MANQNDNDYASTAGGVSQAALDAKAPIASPTFTTQISTPVVTSPSSLVIGAGGSGYTYIKGFSGANTAIVSEKRFVLDNPTFGSVTPAQITAHQNDYFIIPTSGVIQRLSTDASRNITGLNTYYGGNMEGDFHTLVNVGSFNIVLVNQSVSSAVGNRFICSTGADITLAPNEAADILYDTASAGWRVFKK